MAYAKDDFVHFSDIDLKSVLGDFTESEFNYSDSDFEDTIAVASKHSANNKNLSVPKSKSVRSKGKDKQYMCDECERNYASISGLRGHMRSKHGKQSVQGNFTIQ